MKLFRKKSFGPRKECSYSQMGEDIIMQYILRAIGMKSWTWLDIGAYDPDVLSNTALWYKNGMRGINVEANPKLILNFGSR